MAKPILVPQVGQDLTEGKILELNVKVGDKVKKGDIVATVESEKAAFEVEAFEEGTVLEICYGEDEMGTVLEPLMYVGAEGETVSGSGSDSDAEEKPAQPVAALAPIAAAVPDGRLRASPVARKLAAINQLDLTAVTGTGPRAAIVKRDVEAAIAAAADSKVVPIIAPAVSEPPKSRETQSPAPAILPPSSQDDVEIPHTRMRQVIADRLLASKQTIPHFYLQADVDVTDLSVRRKQHNTDHSTRISINDVLIRSTALTLLEHRGLNVHVGEDRIVRKGQINIGMAVSVPDGLMVPVLANADQLDLQAISSEARSLADAARRGISKSSAPGTFSISNLGMFGVDVFPIINPPEAAILGVGPAREQLVPRNGGIFVRQIMKLTLSVDHRAVDGAMAAAFLSRLAEVIETFRFE